MGSFIKRNIQYQLHLLWKAVVITVAVFILLVLYWNMLTGGAPNQPFFIVMAVLIPFTLCYQNTSVYLNITLGTCNTRRSAFAAAQIVKLLTAVIFAILGVGADMLSSLLMTGGASFDLVQCALTILLIVFAMSAGEVLGHFTHRFGKIGAILFGIFCGLAGGLIGFIFSMAFSTEETLVFTSSVLTMLPAWLYLLFFLLAVGFTILTYTCFLRRYGVK